MRVMYDHQVFWLQQYGGISRYFVEIMNRLRERNVDVQLSLWYSENKHLLSSGLIEQGVAPSKPFLFDLVKYGQRKTGKDLIGYFDHRSSNKALEKNDFDIFHPTYYYPYFLSRLQKRPFVLTVHDMIHERMPQFFGPSNPTAANKKMLAERASRIITVSNSTKNDLVEICGIDPSIIEVIHLASTLDPSKITPKMPENIPDRFILFTGNRHGYKNFLKLAHAVAPIFKEQKDLYLICGGGGPFSEEEQAVLKDLSIFDRTRQVDVDDRVLVALYQKAQFFVYPSMYEGFGIPLLEAFACGCPVIASNRSSFPEVVGDAGMLFDVQDDLSLRESIEKLLNDANLRSTMSERGYAQEKKFSWDITAERTKAVYDGVLNG